MQALELRVHGVSGTPPEDLLDRPLVQQLAGDRIAGFYTPRLPGERTDASPNVLAPPLPDAPELVGYSWGGLTSGSPGRAFWLLLLPFTLINIAPRARPNTHDATSRFTWLIWYLCRLLALTLTVLFVLAGVGVGEDLIAWQCAGSTNCQASMPRWVVQQDVSVERMLLLGALVPVVLLLILWRVSARTANNYEETVAHLGGYRAIPSAEDDEDTNKLEVGLGSRLMWRNADPVRRLRAAHMQCAFAVILWTVLAPTDSRWLAVVPLAVVLYCVFTLGSRRFTGHGHSTAWQVASWAVWGVLGLAAIWLVIGLVRASIMVRPRYVRSVPDHGRTAYHGLPFFDATVLADAGIATVLIVALIVVVAIAAATGSRPEPAGAHVPLPHGLFAMVTAAFASLGVFLAAAFSSGIYVYVATFLHTGSLKPGFGDVSTVYQTFKVPPAVATATLAYTWAVAGLVVLLVIFAFVVGYRVWRPGGAEPLASDYPAGADAKRGTQIRRAMTLGGLVDTAPWLIGPLVLTGLVVVTVCGVQLGLHASTPIEDLFGSGIGWQSKNFLSGVGAYLVVLTLLGLVSLGAIAFRVPATRRIVGILWDVASFWPRAAHPLAPPCYAERTVPDLVTFVTAQRIGDDARTVVLAAHSQGTVISAATIFQLEAFDAAGGGDQSQKVLPGLGFLSFGCVLRRLYGRYFPVYFGTDQLAKLQGILSADGDLAAPPRWRNLWRYTDYLGGQVVSGPPQDVPAGAIASAGVPFHGPHVDWEWHAPDPPRFGRAPGDTTYSPAHRHSDFWKDESGYFQLAVVSLATQIEPGTG